MFHIDLIGEILAAVLAIQIAELIELELMVLTRRRACRPALYLESRRDGIRNDLASQECLQNGSKNHGVLVCCNHQSWGPV